ncbi:MAG: hypothetical protein WC967_01560, partial [Balneolaceae bacterium]
PTVSFEWWCLWLTSDLTSSYIGVLGLSFHSQIYNLFIKVSAIKPIRGKYSGEFTTTIDYL